MRARILAGFALAIFASPAWAHHFWLQPQGFHLSAPGSTSVRFLIGDGADVEPWSLRKQRVTSLRTYGPTGVIDHKAAIREGEANGGATIAFNGTGAYILALESIHSFIELPAGEFNEYIEHEGVAPIQKDRATPEAKSRPGRELYSRRAKALIRVGEGDDDIFLRPLGMTLEIVPERCPYHLERGEALPVRVYFHGTPLPGAQIELASLDRPSAPPILAITDANGRASFNFERTGRWLLALVWSEPLEDRTRADYDTTFSSLTFGF